MAQFTSEPPSFIDGGKTRSRRQGIWLWLTLSTEADLPETEDYEGNDFWNRVKEYLDNNSSAWNRTRRDLARHLIPDEEITWITDDNELLTWLGPELKTTRGFRSFLGMPPHLSQREKIILALDYWKVDRSKKRDALRGLHLAWNERLNRRRLLRWFAKENEYEKCDLLWEWLRNNRPQLIIDCPPFETANAVANFFKQTNLRVDEDKHIINTIKRRWSQRKYRAKLSGKMQCNFILSTSADRALDRLSKLRELSRSQLLEILIQDEVDRSR